MEQNTIRMTARESAFYNLGIVLGGVQGTERAAELVKGASTQLRDWPASKQLGEWLANMGQRLASLRTVLDAPDQVVFKGAVDSLADVAKQVAITQNEIANWVECVALNLEADALTQRAHFTELMAAVGSDGAVPVADSMVNPGPRAPGSLLARLGRRVIVELYAAVQDGKL